MCFSTIDPHYSYNAIKPNFSDTLKEQSPQLAMPPTLPTALSQTSKVKDINSTWHSETIKPGTRLADIFAKYQLDYKQLQEVLNSSPAAKRLETIKPGQKVDLLINAQNKLLALNYHFNKTDTLKITTDADSLVANLKQVKPEKNISYASGVIKNSFYVAAQKAGLNNKQIIGLVKAFNSRIDFSRDIHPGDSFHVLYNEELVNGKKIRNGDIIAAEFKTLKGKSYKIIKYTDPKGHSDYYTPDGNSTSLAFIRKPIANARISSPFSMRRIHPILHTPMPHYGTDFASPIGTPIKATGNGKIAFVGKQNGYGNVIIIKHNERISTLYAHMSRFAKSMQVGTRVKLGQIIGYVGMTGRADGPHVHYEFRKSNKRYDPMKVQLPHSEAIPRSYRPDFMAKLAKLTKLLDKH